MPKRKGSPIMRNARARKPRLHESKEEPSVASDMAFSSTDIADGFHVNQDNQVIIPASQPSLPAFECQPLNLDSNTFRTIKIIPGPEETPIKCTMRNTSMEDEDYVCLSYTWEPRLPFHDIELNGMILTIGDNLWQFLRKARLANIKEPLWIDTLRINQSYHAEKNHQVALMGKIYKGAKKVLIWLGLDNMDGDMLGRVTKCALHLNRQVSLQATVMLNL
ncbi:heterokaryon incompatibility -domain-containing protein [Rutstroemia sp. NJR-2017a BVV2]|nr:heterokaryon incompatibility -domain-containing protein [Rutstroemia sp. NJR-2017a BVV2]